MQNKRTLKEIADSIRRGLSGAYHDLKELYDDAGEFREAYEKDFLRDGKIAILKGHEIIEKEGKISYIMEGLLPENSLVVLYGKAGLGKTQLVLQMAKAITTGEPIFNLQTKKVEVFYCNYDNPEAVLAIRIKQTNCLEVNFLLSPPRLDSDDWIELKNLPKGSLIIIDSLRTAHNLDENSSKDMSFVMRRAKEIRDSGHSVIVIHHTVRSNERSFRGSGAIEDQADHVLALYPVRKKGEEFEEIDIEDYDDPEAVFYFGTKGKTRYENFGIYIKRNPDSKVWTLTVDPITRELKSIGYIIGELTYELGREPMQKEILERAKEEGFTKHRLFALLKKGEGKFWEIKEIERKRGKPKKAYSLIERREEVEDDSKGKNLKFQNSNIYTWNFGINGGKKAENGFSKGFAKFQDFSKNSESLGINDGISDFKGEAKFQNSNEKTGDFRTSQREGVKNGSDKDFAKFQKIQGLKKDSWNFGINSPVNDLQGVDVIKNSKSDGINEQETIYDELTEEEVEEELERLLESEGIDPESDEEEIPEDISDDIDLDDLPEPDSLKPELSEKILSDKVDSCLKKVGGSDLENEKIKVRVKKDYKDRKGRWYKAGAIVEIPKETVDELKEKDLVKTEELCKLKRDPNELKTLVGILENKPQRVVPVIKGFLAGVLNNPYTRKGDYIKTPISLIKILKDLEIVEEV